MHCLIQKMKSENQLIELFIYKHMNSDYGELVLLWLIQRRVPDVNVILSGQETGGENQDLSDSARKMHTVNVGAPCLRCGDSKKRGPQAWT